MAWKQREDDIVVDIQLHGASEEIALDLNFSCISTGIPCGSGQVHRGSEFWSGSVQKMQTCCLVGSGSVQEIHAVKI